MGRRDRTDTEWNIWSKSAERSLVLVAALKGDFAGGLPKTARELLLMVTKLRSDLGSMLDRC